MFPDFEELALLGDITFVPSSVFPSSPNAVFSTVPP